MNSEPSDQHNQGPKLPGENIIRTALSQIEFQVVEGWDKGYPPSHDVYHDTRYHDWTKGGGWTQHHPWPRG